MKPCISQATCLSTPFEADLPAYSRAGWPAVELWLTKLETFLERHTIQEARERLDANGLEPAAAAMQGGLLLSKGVERVTHWEHFQRRLDLLHELAVPVLVVAADFLRDPAPEDYGRAAEALAEAGSAAKQAGVMLALEFQKSAKFCASLDTTLALIAQSRAESVGVCLDLFHYYTGPSKFEDLAYLTPQNLAWVQVCDLTGTPREVAGDADRILPGEGEFQIVPILEQLDRIGYAGHVSVELLNPQLWGIPVDRVADFGRRAISGVLGRWEETAPSPEPSGGP
jgi:sugar phosphate isomerase/epimerase